MNISYSILFFREIEKYSFSPVKLKVASFYIENFIIFFVKLKIGGPVLLFKGIFFIPNAFLPLFSAEAMLSHNTFGKESVIGQKSWCVYIFLIISIFGLNCITSQEDGCFWRAVNFISQNGIFDLQLKVFIEII